MINIPKGTKDVLPSDSYKWQYVEGMARKLCLLFNAKEIRTPVFEHTELFLRSIGSDTDVASKEMYTFEDKGKRSITLKPEGTAPVARSYIENNLADMSLPLKMFYITPVFRYERPQEGRLREHHQFGVEFYGDCSPYMDYEVISLAYKYLTSLSIPSLSLNINSIGCPSCRHSFNESLKNYLQAHTQDMCSACSDRFSRNPLRILDCKEEICQGIVKNAPQITSFLCDDCSNHFQTLKDLLKANNIPFKQNPLLVRGLDYYTGTVFEFITEALGAQGTVCGGGRYNHMVENIGGQSTPAVGFGLGLERLIMLMERLEIPFEQNQLDYFVLAQSPEHFEESYKILQRLRERGFSADIDFLKRSLKAQFRYCNKQNAAYAIVIGESELQTGIINIKRMSDGAIIQKRIEEL